MIRQGAGGASGKTVGPDFSSPWSASLQINVDCIADKELENKTANARYNKTCHAPRMI
jgi:hypothetical protein